MLALMSVRICALAPNLDGSWMNTKGNAICSRRANRKVQIKRSLGSLSFIQMKTQMRTKHLTMPFPDKGHTNSPAKISFPCSVPFCFQMLQNFLANHQNMEALPWFFNNIKQRDVDSFIPCMLAVPSTTYTHNFPEFFIEFHNVVYY